MCEEEGPGLNERPGWDIYFLTLAGDVLKRSTCLRRRWGAVLVTPDHRIVGTGYCGAPRGFRHCTERGICWREEHEIPHGTDYTRCYSVHAEQNALLQAGLEAEGATMYIRGEDARTGEPAIGHGGCLLCAKMMINAGVKRVVEYRGPDKMPYETTPLAAMTTKLQQVGMAPQLL